VRRESTRSRWPSGTGTSGKATWVLTKKWIATKSVFKLGDAPEVRIEAYDGKKESMLWHIYFVHGGKSYYIAVAMPPGTGKVLFPN
jgi:hypothetical protein